MRFLLRAPVLIAVFSVIMAAVAVVTIFLVIRPQSKAAPSVPLRLIGSPSVKRTPDGTAGCNTNVSFMASGSVSGSGTLTYQWEPSDGATPVLRQIPIGAGQSSFQTDPVVWSFSGTQQTSVTMTLHILKPSDLKIATSFSDVCK